MTLKFSRVLEVVEAREKGRGTKEEKDLDER